jgi:hypothetical protein
MKTSLACLVLLLGLVLSPPVRGQDVAALIPADALAVVICDNINQLEADIQAFGQSIGTPVPPGMLDQFPLVLSINPDQWQRNRPLAAAALDETHWAVFVPVAADLKESLDQTGVPNRDGVYQLGFASAVVREGYLVLSMSAETLAPFRTKPDQALMAKLSPLMKEARDDSDLFYYVNLPKLRPIAAKGFDELERSLNELASTAFQVDGLEIEPAVEVEAEDAAEAAEDAAEDAGNAVEDAVEDATAKEEAPQAGADEADEGHDTQADFQKLMDQQIAGIRLYAMASDYLLSQGESYFGGVNVSAEAISGDAMFVVRADSEMNGWLQGLPEPRATLLDRLPKGSIYMAGGFDGSVLRQPILRGAKAMFNERDLMKRLGMELPENTDELMRLLERLYNAEAMQFSMDLGKSLTVDSWIGYQDPADAFAAYKTFQEKYPEFVRNSNPGMELVPVENPEPVGDLRAIVYEFQFDEDATGLMAQQRQAMEMIFGEDPRIVAVQLSDGMGSFMGRSPDEILAMNKPAASSLANEPRIEKTLAALPPNPFALVLIDPTVFVRAMKNGAGIFGQIGGGFDFKLPEEDPQPWALATDASADGVGVHFRVPAESIGYMVHAYLSLAGEALPPPENVPADRDL